MNALFALIKLTFYQQVRHKALPFLVLFNGLVVVAAMYAPATNEVDQTQLFYSIVLSVTGLLTLLLALFTSAMTFPQDVSHKTIYPVLVRPIRPIEVLLGRIVGAMVLVVGHLAVITALVVAMVHLGWVQPPPATSATVPHQGVDIKGAFNKPAPGVYWTTSPSVTWKVDIESPTFDPMTVFALKGQFIKNRWAEDWEDLAPFVNYQIQRRWPTPLMVIQNRSVRGADGKNHASVLVAVDIENKVSSSKEGEFTSGQSKVEWAPKDYSVVFHQEIMVSGQPLVLTIPPHLIRHKGRAWKVTVIQEDLEGELVLAKDAVSFLIPNIFYYDPRSPQFKSHYRRFPATDWATDGVTRRGEGEVILEGTSLIWHFHRDEAATGPLHFQWQPSLTIVNSQVPVQVSVGQTPYEFGRPRELEVRDNQVVDMTFPPLEGENIYLQMKMVSARNRIGLDINREVTGRPKNGVVLVRGPFSRWHNYGRHMALLIMKLALVALAAGVFSTFLSPFVALFFGVFVYLCGHSLATIGEFSQALSGEGWRAYLGQGLAFFVRVFPDFTQYDTTSALVYGHFIPLSCLGGGAVYLLLYSVVLIAFAGLILSRKEYR